LTRSELPCLINNMRDTEIAAVSIYRPLWLGDNGRCTCGDLRCAGSTAHASRMRRDLSGGPMERVTLDVAREAEAHGITLRCEGCGALPQTVEVAG